MTTPNIVNGVNVDQLFGVIEAVKGTPTIADFKFRVQNKWMNGGHNQTTVGNFYGACQVQTREGFVVDNAEHQILLGEDQSPNPVEYVLHALAGCITTSLVYHAAARGHKITAVASHLPQEPSPPWKASWTYTGFWVWTRRFGAATRTSVYT